MKLNNTNNNKNFTSLNPLSVPLGAFFNKNATIPTLIIETGVTTGRTIQANKRGGKREAIDRCIEQGVSAAVWIWGVQALQKAGNIFCKNILKLGDLNFNIGKDILRNPVKNNKISTKLTAAKASNILISTALATYFIGFILPKISRSISKKYSKKDEVSTPVVSYSFDEFKNKTNKNIPFTSLLSKSIQFADTIENNSTIRLLTTDTGVIAGRCKNAKNTYHRIENLFRDISSVYFYLFAVDHVVKGLNYITKNVNINPKILSKLTEKLKTIDSDKDFLTQALGTINKNDEKTLKELFKSKEVISLQEFIEKFPDKKDIAYKMTELQPVFNNKRVLTYLQAKDVISGAKIADPEFLKQTFSLATNGASNNKLKFVPKKDLEKMRYSMDEYIKRLYESSKNNITPEFIEKFANKNIIKSFGFYSIGTAISILVLGIIIPKIQYAITKKLTNKNEFPGA